MTTSTPAHATPMSQTTARSGSRSLGTLMSVITRPIRWIVTFAARSAAAGQLGRDPETEIGRWTGARI